jgi:hypothetical protein
VAMQVGVQDRGAHVFIVGAATPRVHSRE